MFIVHQLWQRSQEKELLASPERLGFDTALTRVSGQVSKRTKMCEAWHELFGKKRRLLQVLQERVKPSLCRRAAGRLPSPKLLLQTCRRTCRTTVPAVSRPALAGDLESRTVVLVLSCERWSLESRSVVLSRSDYWNHKYIFF